MATSGSAGSSDDYNRRKKLIAWIKEKNSILYEFRGMLRVPFDIGLYSQINIIQDKMFTRRSNIMKVVDGLRFLSSDLDALRLPIYNVEDALLIIKKGKKPLDSFKTNYLMQAKKNHPDYEELEKLVQGEDSQIVGDIEKSYNGYFEEIGFCIERYFQTHHYSGKKVICQIGDLAEIELLP